MDLDKILTELEFSTARSSGPGGQHANKTETRVALSFNLQASEGLTEEEKERLSKKLENRINKDGALKFFSEESRSQHTNKEIVIKTFTQELQKALRKKKPRKKTKPTKASKIKRLKKKRHKSEIKANRKKPKL